MNQTDPYSAISKQLEKRTSQNRLRSLKTSGLKPSASRIFYDDETAYINFSSNDYLGLAGHPALKKASIEYTRKYGTGSASSRLITGSHKIHQELEQKLAALYKRERTLLFNTGFQANSTILPALTSKNDWIIADKQCHNSIITGCLASAASFFRFRHNDLNHLEHFLKRAASAGAENIWIVTESVFSMDGDIALMDEIISLSNKFRSKIYLDDAHAIGVFGESGLGFGVRYPEVDIVVGTFGKAVGSFGAFAACHETIAQGLINFCNGFIYTTALPPGVIGAVGAAYDLIPGMKKERDRIQSLSEKLHNRLLRSGFSTGKIQSHILPVITGSDRHTISLSEKLDNQKISAVAIRPPTVPEGESRIRLSVTSDHTEDDLNLLIKALGNV